MAKGIDTSGLIAAFVAKGGNVNRVQANVRTMTERELYFAARDKDRQPVDPINERRVIVDHAGRERVCNGLGEWIA